MRKERLAANYAGRYSSTAAATESQVAELNARTEAQNGVVMQVLAETTGKKYETPKAWWDWWQERNGYANTERPVEQHYYAGTDKINYGEPSYSVPAARSAARPSGWRPLRVFR